MDHHAEVAALTCGVELVAEARHVPVVPRPLAVGEELEHLEALLQPAHPPHQHCPLAAPPGDEVDGVGGQEVQEEVQQAVLHLVPRQGDAGWSEEEETLYKEREETREPTYRSVVSEGQM